MTQGFAKEGGRPTFGYGDDVPPPHAERLRRPAYEAEKALLQIELLKVQRWARDTGQRIVVLFEGRDAAGKGGTIKRFMEHLNPRGARVVALPKPGDTERGQWFFQRYVAHLPTSGEIVLFDRSWYNRAGVERVMGYCSEFEYRSFLHQCPAFESMLIESGIRLFKFWFAVSREEQRRRIERRRHHPLKHWKLTPVDTESLGRWDDYTDAMNVMFERTDTDEAPWVIVRSDDKRRARLASMHHFLHSLPYPDRNESLVTGADPRVLRRAGESAGQ